MDHSLTLKTEIRTTAMDTDTILCFVEPDHNPDESAIVM